MKIFSYLYKFLLVSLSSTIIDLGVFNFLFVFIKFKSSVASFVLIKSISFSLAVINSFVWNKRWVFQNKNSTINSKRQFVTFLIINIFSLIINVSISSIVFSQLQNFLFVGWFYANIAAISGSLSGMLINFNGYKKIFFKT